MVSIPYSLTDVKQQREEKIYTVKIYQPHLFSIAINEANPDAATFYAVNIGAGDGKSYNDPVYPLFQMGYSGLAVEGEKNKELEINLPSNRITKMIGTYVAPGSIGGILKNANCPPNPDFFKIDIDGYDASIMNTILELGYRPKVLQIEVNPEFPPPIEFFVHYDPQYRVLDKKKKIGGFYGLSMAYAVNVAKCWGYKLAYMDFVTDWTHDITLIHSSCFDFLSGKVDPGFQEKTIREIFLAHPPGAMHFKEHGIDSFQWRHREDYHNLLIDIWNACLTSNLKKHKGRCIPFYLNISPRY